MKLRSGFSMITAIFIILMMATVAGFVLSLSGKIVKSTTAQYQREQAMLLAKSYTEYAVLSVMSNDRNGTCLQTINGNVGSSPSTGDGYQITVNIYYIGNAQEVGNCGSNIFSSTVVNAKSPLSIVVDSFVRYKDIDNATADWLTYHKRTLQKI